MNDKPIEKCSHKLYVGAWLRPKDCTRNAVPGTKFCKQHNPESIAARNKARNDRWDKQSAVRHKHYALMAAAPKLLQIVEALDAWYKESTGGPSASALLFDDQRTLAEHITEAIEITKD